MYTKNVQEVLTHDGNDDGTNVGNNVGAQDGDNVGLTEGCCIEVWQDDNVN